MKNNFKIIFWFISVLLFSRCKSDNCFLSMYPNFKNCERSSDSNYISLNNFIIGEPKVGKEYILTKKGSLIEIRNWKNNLLNGEAYKFCLNGQLLICCNYLNGELMGNFIGLDSISGEPNLFIEYLKTKDKIFANQIINFKEGKILFNSSCFYSVRCEPNKNCVIKVFCDKRFNKKRIFLNEQNTDNYNFDLNNSEIELEQNKDGYFSYNQLSNNKRYVSGYAYISREVKTNDGENNLDSFGRYIFIKFNSRR